MKDENIEKVLNVWEKDNRIIAPNKKIQIEIINQIASLFTVGPFYYFIFNFNTLEMDYVSDGITEVLGISPKQYLLQTYFDLMHPDDLSSLNEKEAIGTEFLFNKIEKQYIPYYKVGYLIRAKHSSGNFKNILHQSRAINITEEGKIQQVLTIHTDISDLNILSDDKVSFIGSGIPSYYAIKENGKYEIVENHSKNNFTNREIEVIRNIAQGKTSIEIGKKLFLSPHTVNTHKKNILRKAECKNTAELVAKCISEGVI